MGTNYYWVKEKKCPNCNFICGGTRIHIGKSSGGWCFALHIYPDKGINNITDWVKKFIEPYSYIEDEYNNKIKIETMLNIIIFRNWKDQPSKFRRHKDQYCVGHGEGLYDYIIGEFS